MLNRTDVAVLVVDGRAGLQKCDRQLIDLFRQKNIPYVVAWNKSDLSGSAECPPEALRVSAKTGENIFALKEKIAHLGNAEDPKLQLVGDLIAPGQLAVLVIPIDKAAPKGRLILPQQQAHPGHSGSRRPWPICVTRETELPQTLSKLRRSTAQNGDYRQSGVRYRSRLQRRAHGTIPLTSFSILYGPEEGAAGWKRFGACRLPSTD